MIKYWRPFEQKAILQYLARFEGEDIFYDIAVQDILWGYEDPMLKLVHTFDKDLVPDPRFGFMYKVSNSKNNSYPIFDLMIELISL